MNIMSWNVTGLNHAVKRRRVLPHLQHFGVGIAFIQETHLRNNEHFHIDWVGQVFHSKFYSKSRGAAILIHKNVPFITSNIISDPNVRYVMVVGQLFQLHLVLVNIYAPNFDDENFFKKMLSSIPNLDSHHLILSGDYDLVMDSLIQCQSHRYNRSRHSWTHINSSTYGGLKIPLIFL